MISKYNASDVTNYYTTPFSCSTYMGNKRAHKKHIKQMLEHHLSKNYEFVHNLGRVFVFALCWNIIKTTQRTNVCSRLL